MSYLKIMYIMFLVNKCTAKEIMEDKNGLLHDCTRRICGSWEGYTQAMGTRNDIMVFIKKYIMT